MYKERLLAYMERYKLSQSAMAKKLDTSISYLSQYLNDKHPYAEKFEDKLKEFFAMAESQAGSTKKPEFVPTTVSNLIMDGLGYAHIQKIMGVMDGDAGIGKTWSIRQYEKQHTEAVVLSIDYPLSKPMGFLKALARELRVPELRRQDDLYTAIVERLKGSEKILIIDEAQHLPYSSLEIIRGIHDAAEIAVVLVGNHEVYDKLLGRGAAAFAQLYSRIAIRKSMKTTDIKMTDIERIFPDIEDEAQKFLYEISKTRWGLRAAVNAYVNGSNADDVSKKGLEKVIRYMGVGGNVA